MGLTEGAKKNYIYVFVFVLIVILLSFFTNFSKLILYLSNPYFFTFFIVLLLILSVFISQFRVRKRIKFYNNFISRFNLEKSKKICFNEDKTFNKDYYNICFFGEFGSYFIKIGDIIFTGGLQSVGGYYNFIFITSITNKDKILSFNKREEYLNFLGNFKILDKSNFEYDQTNLNIFNIYQPKILIFKDAVLIEFREDIENVENYQKYINFAIRLYEDRYKFIQNETKQI